MIEVCETGVVDGLAEAQGVVRNLRRKKAIPCQYCKKSTGDMTLVNSHILRSPGFTWK